MRVNKKASTNIKFIMLGGISLLCLFLAIGIGTVWVSPIKIMQVTAYRLFNTALSANIPDTLLSIIWDVRLPRALTAFLVGAALSISGALMQSILQNPLASSFTLGVSSGASLGASLVFIGGFSILGLVTLPVTAFLFGFLTILLVIGISSAIDNGMQNHTIVLIGMVVSFFANAILMILVAVRQDGLKQLISWQMGSLHGKRWNHVAIIFFVTLVSFLLAFFRSRELDILSFGDSQAQTIGVNTKNSKWFFILLSSALTGVAVCFTGTIGFVDLIAPHIVRRVFGPNHRFLLPASALFGGGFLALSDMIARVIIPKTELPVGAITALIGAPFFAFIFFQSKRRS